MQVKTSFNDYASIAAKGGVEVCSELSTTIARTLELLTDVRGAKVVNLTFAPPGRGAQSCDQAIGTPLFAMILSVRSGKEVRHLPSIGGQFLTVTFYRTPDGKGCIVPHVLDRSQQKYKGSLDALIPDFAQTVLRVLTANA